ncbi:hypothetical protein MPSEU_001088300 [Mayamaea pseudoterrestris]|nr:hypothetical protein MPSEU_001088300 [Mayamaea pseudoterrestris]
MMNMQRLSTLLLLLVASCSSWSMPQPNNGGRTIQRANKPMSNQQKALATTMEAPQEDVKIPQLPKLGVAIWVAGLSGFIVRNYQPDMEFWPATLSDSYSSSTYILIHAVSGMLFAGTIITTTLLEWIVVQSKDQAVQRFWFTQVPGVEQALVLPGLTGSIVSGVLHAFQKYGSLTEAPFHVTSAVYLLLLFGVWWGVTDQTTQGKAFDYVMSDQDMSDDKLPTVMLVRRVSNIVSCGFLVALYAVMVLKPGME